jgi:hypothetical protein
VKKLSGYYTFLDIKQDFDLKVDAVRAKKSKIFTNNHYTLQKNKF